MKVEGLSNVHTGGSGHSSVAENIADSQGTLGILRCRAIFGLLNAVGSGDWIAFAQTVALVSPIHYSFYATCKGLAMRCVKCAVVRPCKDRCWRQKLDEAAD